MMYSGQIVCTYLVIQNTVNAFQLDDKRNNCLPNNSPGYLLSFVIFYVFMFRLVCWVLFGWVEIVVAIAGTLCAVIQIIVNVYMCILLLVLSLYTTTKKVCVCV